MSFSIERTVYCFGNQFQYCLLIGCIKMLAFFKRPQFKDSESDMTEPKISKHPHIDVCDNEEGQDSEEY